MHIPTLIGEALAEILAEEAAATPLGALAEVGVYKGGSAYALHKRNPERVLYLYDTFSGIPEKTEGIDVHSIGDFADTDVEDIRKILPDALIKVGVFPYTFVVDKYAFVHVDCDQYASVKACIDTFAPYMVKGGKMWFDDYGCLAGATKAVEDSGIPYKIVTGGKALMEF